LNLAARVKSSSKGSFDLLITVLIV
jgi:hypothetical protein